MHCPHCQQDNPVGSRFCNGCGAQLEVACPACNHVNPTGSRFCNGCGNKLGGHAVTSADTRFVSPQSYTPKHLAEKILTSKAALEGERKQVTVLFADLKGSMELLADRDPEEARKLLDPVLEHMMEAVHRYEGTVNQVMGDGIMALFGAPLAHEDHAVRACYAALRMQESVKRYAERVRRESGVAVRIRVGLNSGEVVVRAIGSDLHMDYTAVGQTTHLAARMEQLAAPGSILLTPSTVDLVEGFVAVKSLGPVPVKGLAAPVEVYEVTGAGPVRTRLQAATRRGLTRFVGRDAEVEQLRRAQQLAGNGHGQVAAIVGEAGVGKSRLVYEFTHSHRLQGWLTLESASVSYGKATSYLPVIDLLKGYFKIQDGDDLREIREKVMGKLLTLDRALEPTLPALLALLDVPADDAAWQTLDPGQRRKLTLDAVKRLLLREAREQPLLVIFEDLHWIDSETQALLDGLVESLGSARLLLLVNYRPEYQHPWGSRTYYSQLRLDVLPAASAGELLEALLGDDPGMGPLKQLLVKRGNPFFLEETVLTLVETDALVGERGRYRLTQPVQTIQVPATVQVILAARIDRLAPEDKRLLQIAAVVGKDVPFALLQPIAELPDDALRRGLDHLQAAEFLYETSFPPDLAFTFKHALTHEVAYGSLLNENRRALHRQIVGAIETMYAGRQAEHIEQLGNHAFRGEAWEQAVTYLREAGMKALSRSANKDAAAHFERALTASTHADHHNAKRQAVDLSLAIGSALFALGRITEVVGRLREAEPIAQDLEDKRILGTVYSFLGECLWLTGQNVLAADYAQRGLEIAVALKSLPLQVGGNFILGHAYHARGDYRRALEHIGENVRVLQGELVYKRMGQAGLASVLSRTWIAWSHAQLGSFAEARAQAEEAVRIAERANHPFSIVSAYLATGIVWLQQGDERTAMVALEKAYEVSTTWDLRLWIPMLAPHLASAYARSGRVNDALTVLDQAEADAASTGIAFSRSLRVAAASEICCTRGQIEKATALAEQALVFANEDHERGHAAYVLRILGEIASHADSAHAQTAGQRYQQALLLATELGMRPLVAHCHLGLGKLYRRTGERAKAQGHLSTATTMYREMGMRFWLEQAEAESKELA